jgi:hypothetical protein
MVVAGDGRCERESASSVAVLNEAQRGPAFYATHASQHKMRGLAPDIVANIVLQNELLAWPSERIAFYETSLSCDVRSNFV